MNFDLRKYTHTRSNFCNFLINILANANQDPVRGCHSYNSSVDIFTKMQYTYKDIERVTSPN